MLFQRGENIIICQESDPHAGKAAQGGNHEGLPERNLYLENLEMDIHVLFVGNFSSGYQDVFDKEVSKSIHPYTVHPHVGSDELVAMYCASDIAVYPVQATISTVEASACGLPIICTNEIP